MRRLLLTLATLLALASPARADEAVGEMLHEAPLAGYGGWAAWSAYGEGRYRLTLRAPDGRVRDAPLPSQDAPFDVSLGPDARGAVVAIYVRAGDVYRLPVTGGAEEKLRSVSAPSFAEATPAIWRSTVAFTRRVRGCDVPYVKTLGSSAPSKRLLRTKCLETPAGHLAIRGTRIVASSIDRSETDEIGSGEKYSEIRRYSSNGGPTRLLGRQGFGEESNLFGQVAIDEHFVSSVRYGVHPKPSFLRVRTTGGSLFETPANAGLTGAFAKSSAGTSLYVAEQDEAGCNRFVEVPCRVVRAPRSPFGRAVRPLPPRLTVAYDGAARQSRPLTLRGVLTRPVVQDGVVIRTEPLAGVVVDLRRRVGSSPERFEPTPYRAVTGPDGRYEIHVAPPIPREPWFTAVAATEPVATWAGRGTVGQATP